MCLRLHRCGQQEVACSSLCVLMRQQLRACNREHVSSMRVAEPAAACKGIDTCTAQHAAQR